MPDGPTIQILRYLAGGANSEVLAKFHEHRLKIDVKIAEKHALQLQVHSLNIYLSLQNLSNSKQFKGNN